MKKLAYLYALAAIGLWSTLATISTHLSQVPPLLLVGCTLLIGGLCGLLGNILWRPREVINLHKLRVSGFTLSLGIYGIFGYHFFLFLAFRNAPPIEVNLLNYLWPLLIVLLAPVFLPSLSLQKKHFVGALLGFFGALLIISNGQFKLPSENSLGYLFAAIAAFIWATYSLLTKRVADTRTSTVALFCLISGLLSFFSHKMFEPNYRPKTNEIFLLLALGIGPMGLAFYLWDKALKLGDPRIIGSLSYITPLLSTSLLIVFGKGHFTWISGGAMLLILGGAYISGSRSKAS